MNRPRQSTFSNVSHTTKGIVLIIKMFSFFLNHTHNFCKSSKCFVASLLSPFYTHGDFQNFLSEISPSLCVFRLLIKQLFSASWKSYFISTFGFTRLFLRLSLRCLCLHLRLALFLLLRTHLPVQVNVLHTCLDPLFSEGLQVTY